MYVSQLELPTFNPKTIRYQCFDSLNYSVASPYPMSLWVCYITWTSDWFNLIKMQPSPLTRSIADDLMRKRWSDLTIKCVVISLSNYLSAHRKHSNKEIPLLLNWNLACRVVFCSISTNILSDFRLPCFAILLPEHSDKRRYFDRLPTVTFKKATRGFLTLSYKID